MRPTKPGYSVWDEDELEGVLDAASEGSEPEGSWS